MNSSDQKPSRYRTVRHSNNAAAAPAPTEAAMDPGLNDDNAAGTVNRSRSRYHRKPQQQSYTQSPPPIASPQLSYASPDPTAGPCSAPHQGGKHLRSAPSKERVLTPRAEAERQRRLEDNSASRQGSAGSRGRGAEGTFKPESANRHDSPMLETSAQRTRAHESQAPQQILATTVDVKEEKAAGCFSGLFGRKKSHLVLQQPEKIREGGRKEPQFIKHGGGGIVPGTDAPKSAVNSGERRVLIECNRNNMQFPVDVTTTAAELLQSAANCFSDPIDPKTYVLIEYFSKVGVQRPLRRYEHVREVMNSWDDDSQNTLMVMPAAASGSDPVLLQASNVPLVKPSEKSFVIYYSQKVGKWDRRHIIIRTDGQVVAKKNSTAADKDAINVCHLSDFDIYTPTQRQLSKKIRPPKKLCFAIKSQQKTTMFEATTDFVHFFCTGEKEEAIAFYTGVQTWRSWYLVNMKGEGKKQPMQQPDPFKAFPTRGKSTKKVNHNSDQSMESTYQLGSFKPLIETEKMDFRPSSAEEEPVKPVVRRASKRERHHPPPALPPQQLSEDEPLVKLLDKRASVDEPRSSGTFANGGLLGRSYSQRKRDVADNEAATAQPFTNGPSLVSNIESYRPATSDNHHVRRNSVRRSNDYSAGDIGRQTSTRRPDRGSVDLGRSTSTRVPQKPLVDLTPTYREPPQHARKGRGYNPAATSGGLINAVPSPEDPLGLPPSTDWRGRNSQRELHSTGQTFSPERGTSATRNRARSTSRSRTPQAARFQNSSAYAALTGAPEPTQPVARERERERQLSGGGGAGGEAFVPGGLLEQAAGGWGAGDKGRGVTGTSGRGGAGKPLVDLSEAGMYGKGSLLERQARAEGVRGPVIDRDG
ncbi:hypothetical protein KVT40_004047 [Elsinoe batatas]|uniref:PH domain-containing protein n=1 Tax=Elsinoe batatas TaxID=2601811 RepID=A0A8K0L1Y2_9PEZI|nr:hypothetical protein KVT40_004047 [Elsinoe batatas]